MEDTKTVILADGRKIVLEDDDTILLSSVLNNKVEHTVKIPYPSGGYGGGSLKLSPSGRYLLFSYFSGESEEAFSLFQIENGRLRLFFDSGYRYGEEANYCFVNEEKLFVQTLRTGTWSAEDAETDERGDRYYEFGELNLFHLETHELDRHTIFVYPSEDWEEEKTDIGAFTLSETDGSRFTVAVPWGNVTFHAPLDSRLMIRSSPFS